MDAQDKYQAAIKFAGEKHGKQKVPGTKLPNVVHLSNVAMEVMFASLQSKDFDIDFAVQVALLHDTIEDTKTTKKQLQEKFGTNIAEAVSALTKNEDLPKEERIPDSLRRIKALKKEVWAVKLADRITNLQKPPADWTKKKITAYQQSARMILQELKEGNEYLATRLERKIENYSVYLKK
jgi:guanosine-3',5'-bis(diphosphate) 3'-pyrophosphohydrolase